MRKNWYIYVLVAIVIIVGIKQCEKPPEIKVETKYVTKTDTINETVIDTVFIPRYVTKIRTEKGKDSIIYKSVPDSTTIAAREYDATVKTDSSRADLKIVTTGELLDVRGTITYDQKITTITERRDNSGLFLVGRAAIFPEPESFGVGLDYQIKNTYILGTYVDYNTATNNTNVGVKFGIKIF